MSRVEFKKLTGEFPEIAFGPNWNAIEEEIEHEEAVFQDMNNFQFATE